MIEPGLTQADVGQVRPVADRTDLDGLVVDVIPGDAAPVAPFPLEVGAGMGVPYALGVAGHASVGDVNLAALIGNAADVDGVNVSAIVFDLGLQVAQLGLRHHGHAEPRGGKGGEYSGNEIVNRFQAFSSKGAFKLLERPLNGSDDKGANKVGSPLGRPSRSNIAKK